jgi:hypothetical protein
MLSTRTPTQAQSSADASLITTAIVACAGAGGVVEPAELPPPPQAVRPAVTPVTSALDTARRNLLRCISKVPLSVDRCAGFPG